MAIRSNSCRLGSVDELGLIFSVDFCLATGFAFAARAIEVFFEAAFLVAGFFLAIFGGGVASAFALPTTFFSTVVFLAGFFPAFESVDGVASTRSIPNSELRSSFAMTAFLFLDFAVPVNASFNWELDTASETSSLLSTPRSVNRSSGSVSSRFPIPYMTAARCLQSPAESGQLHRSLISFGCGNIPTFGAVKHFITESLSFPRNKSMIE